MKDRHRLVPTTERLLAGVEAVRPMRPRLFLRSEREGGDLREDVILSLRSKVIPELSSAEPLPVFVGVQGGTNVGKSTVFNALAGHLLSPAVVQASATKHPLIFAHERWRPRLTKGAFGGLDLRELEDPKELLADAARTELLFVRFHGDESLSEWAIVDSPDFDSALETNLLVARHVAALSDITVFVTTGEKYKDRELVRHLEVLRNLKASVILVFNMVDEEIVFRTLLDDLQKTVSLPEETLAIRVPRSAAAHPESEIGELLSAAILEHLSERPSEAVKSLLLERTLERTLEQVVDLTRLFASEIELKERFFRYVGDALERAVDRYEASFDLALPEETLAVRKVLRETELWPKLVIAADVQSSSTPLALVGSGFRRGGEFARRMLLRVTGKDEGAIDDSSAAVKEYAEARDEADFEHLSHTAHRMRQELETFLRENETHSPLAREVAAKFFTPEGSRGFSDTLREEFHREVAERRSDGEDVLEKVDTWLEKHPGARGLIALSAIAFKLAAGILCARMVPPAGVFNILNWLLFAAGYLIGAYLLALVVSLSVRAKKRFERSRIAGARAVLERTLARPLEEITERALGEENLRELEQTVAEIRGATVTPPSRPRRREEVRDPDTSR